MTDNSRVIDLFYINPINQSDFEKLGFSFEKVGEDFKVTFPIGWTLQDIDEDAFTLDLVDKNGSRRGKIDFGNYPKRIGDMWLF